MRPRNPLYGHGISARSDFSVLIGQRVRWVIKQAVPSCLRLFSKTKRAVCFNINRLNRVHLKCDFHGALLRYVFGFDYNLSRLNKTHL